MARSSATPRSKKQGDRSIYREQDRFDSAMISGPPASVLPETGLARLYNAVSYGRWVQGRNGFPLWSAIPFPAMEGREGPYAGAKIGTTIVSQNALFTSDDILNMWVWDDGEHDEILEILSSTQVRVRDGGEKTGTECHIEGKLNCAAFHFGTKQLVLQLGREFWLADALPPTAWQRVNMLYHQPSNSESQFDELKDDLVIFNSGGMFKIITTEAHPYSYKMNGGVPGARVTANEMSKERKYGRRYIYTATRIEGEGLRNSAAGAKIIQETGPNVYDVSSFQDYAEWWTENLVGDSTKTHGELLGDTLANAALDPANHWAPISDGTFTISMNGSEYNIWVDFTGVRTMEEVAERILVALKIHWFDSTCEITAENQILITTGNVDETVIDRVSAGVGGTDISGAAYLNIAAGTIDNDATFAEPVIIEGLVMPTIRITSSVPEQHLTHFRIFESLDIGVYGADPVTGEGNNPQQLVWGHDLRCAFAVFATRSAGGRVEALIGAFEPQDVGSVLEWENGDRETITRYVDSSTVYVEGGYYYDGHASAPQAAAVGDGRVMRCRQSGSRVERTHGAEFLSGDLRKTIYWADGGYSWITEVISENVVLVHDSATRTQQGATIDPVGRNYYDMIDDDTLRGRIKSLLIQNRGHSALPSGNTGKVLPGWIFVAERDSNEFSYSVLGAGIDRTQYAGYHDPGWQTNREIKGAIQSIEEYPNRVIVFCANSVYGGPSNTSTQITLPLTGEAISVFSGLQLLDGSRGVKDWGSIRNVDIGKQFVICSDDSARIFDSFQFGGNLAEDQASGLEAVSDDIRSWQKATASSYHDGELLIWGLEA